MAPHAGVATEEGRGGQSDQGAVRGQGLESESAGVLPAPRCPSQFDTDEDGEMRLGTWDKRGGIRAAIVRNKMLSGVVCAAAFMLLVTIGVSLGGPARSVLPYPLRLCSGGQNGTLTRVSREAFEYWASVHAPPTDNIVIMLADGYGPHYHTMARSLRRFSEGNKSEMLPLDAFLVGSAITSSVSNIITDSAAGATAFANGHKTFNGALGVSPRMDLVAGENFEGKWARRCGDTSGGTSISGATECQVDQVKGEKCCPVTRLANTLEACRARGMATGIVVTTILPHATPAAWSSHSSARWFYDFIAQQQIEADPPLDGVCNSAYVFIRICVYLYLIFVDYFFISDI